MFLNIVKIASRFKINTAQYLRDVIECNTSSSGHFRENFPVFSSDSTGLLPPSDGVSLGSKGQERSNDCDEMSIGSIEVSKENVYRIF